jgi:hypothetical protein
MTDRDRLIELIRQVPYGVSVGAKFEQYFCEKLADYLLANGVIVQKQGEWVSCGLDHNDMEIIKCSECGRKQFGYSKHCANCGAKMKELSK